MKPALQNCFIRLRLVDFVLIIRDEGIINLNNVFPVIDAVIESVYFVFDLILCEGLAFRESTVTVINIGGGFSLLNCRSLVCGGRGVNHHLIDGVALSVDDHIRMSLNPE